MDVTLIQGTLTGLKTAFELAKGMSDLKTMSEVQAKVIEMQQVILEAQSLAMAANAEQYAVTEELRSLKEEIQKIKAWESERQRYKLRQPTIYGAGVVYALRKSACQADEPAHYICTTCYESGRKSILGLHFQERGGYSMWTCPVCKTAVSTGTRGAPSAVLAAD
jgi:rubrerythrin